MFSCEVSPLELELFSLPVHFGGLGIPLPKHLANALFNASRFAIHVIVDSIRNVQHFELDLHDDIIVSVHRDYQRVCDSVFNDVFRDFFKA